MLKRTVLSVYNPIANFHINKIFKASHQHNFQDRTQLKWALIERELPSEPGSLLDIGCSEGIFTRKAADAGYCAWGIEGKAAAIDRATGASATAAGSEAFFANGLLTPRTAGNLPIYDVILLLSVLHQLFKNYGEVVATKMVADLLKSCRLRFIVEMAGTNRKYGHNVLAIENDLESVGDLVQRLLPPGWSKRYAGAIPYTNEEPNRFIYVLERSE